MKKHILKVFVCLCICFVMVSSPLCVMASEATESYTHQEDVRGDKQVVYGRDIYHAIKQIDASSLGIKKLSGITDICCAEDGRTYILCGDDSRVVVLDKEYQFEEELNVHYENGRNCDFSGAMGIYVNGEGNVFIADTFNSRVLIVAKDGVVKHELETPESDIIPADFYFQPSGVLEDELGYLYVNSYGCYYGILLYSDEHEFQGFYGANTVNSTVLDTLAYLWELLTSNDEKKEKQVKALPYTIADLSMDKEGYIYTCTGVTQKEFVEYGQIRKNSPGGTNVLYKRGLSGSANSSTTYNFLETKVVRRLNSPRGQNIVSLDVGDYGYIYALDTTYGKIYVYDEECNLVTVMGGGVGTGKRLGTFIDAAAVAVNGTDVLVADTANYSLTLFELTDFGETLFQAQSLYFDGHYIEAKPYWEEILQQDGNSRLAYRGLSKAYYTEGNMDLAMEYAKIGLDYMTYDYIHQDRIGEFIQKHFLLLFLAVLALVVGIVVFLLKIRKRETPLIKNEKLQCFLSVMLHPFQAFHDVKYKHSSSMKIAIVMTACLFLSETLKQTRCGFLFNVADAENYNVIFTLASTAGLLILWSVANWAICAVMNGKGRWKEIYIVSIYAMLPMVISNVVFLLLSHVVTIDSADLSSSLNMIALIYSLYLLCIGIMTVHDYDFFRFLLTAVVAVFFMILIVFVGFMIVILIQQFGNFLYSLYMEVMYR